MVFQNMFKKCEESVFLQNADKALISFGQKSTVR